MKPPRVPATIEDFVDILAKSGLLGEDAIQMALRDFRNIAVDNRPSSELRAFASYLITHGQLTCWQYSRLCEGRFKGFFLDNYELRDHLDRDDRCSRYVARDVKTGRLVIVAVIPRYVARREDGGPDYRPEDYG
ncbi:MAG: hypothetical protein GX621_12915 [Pirellulaceae bacterium]|nr:hypothetical protein [Pirellulaceae bacterium]